MAHRHTPTGSFQEAKRSATRSNGMTTTVSFEPSEPPAHSDGLDVTNPGTMDMEKLTQGVRLILEAVGEDVNRSGLLDTPSRVARMYRELLYGTHIDPASEVTCYFEEGTDDPVIVKNIPFATICEHHLVPFIGKTHV